MKIDFSNYKMFHFIFYLYDDGPRILVTFDNATIADWGGLEFYNGDKYFPTDLLIFETSKIADMKIESQESDLDIISFTYDNRAKYKLCADK